MSPGLRDLGIPVPYCRNCAHLMVFSHCTKEENCTCDPNKCEPSPDWISARQAYDESAGVEAKEQCISQMLTANRRVQRLHHG